MHLRASIAVGFLAASPILRRGFCFYCVLSLKEFRYQCVVGCKQTMIDKKIH